MPRARVTMQFDVLIPDGVDPASLTVEFISGGDYDGVVINAGTEALDDVIIDGHGTVKSELVEDDEEDWDEEDDFDGDGDD